MASQVPISVCMIAGAEAHRIRRALESVAPWAGEILVVINDDVADGTEAVAATCGAKVFREPWKGYMEQKNSVAEKASEDWLLSLDADEEVSAALREEIMAVVAKPAAQSRYNAYSFPRCSYYCGKWIRHGDWYPDRQTRLWRRGKAKWGGINPHDRLEVQGEVGRLRSDLWHYSMESFDHQLRKFMNYADDFARECEARGRRVGFLDLLCRPAWRFLRGYIFKLGFLDGRQGYVIARMTAIYTFLRYLKAHEAQNRRAAS